MKWFVVVVLVVLAAGCVGADGPIDRVKHSVWPGSNVALEDVVATGVGLHGTATYSIVTNGVRLTLVNKDGAVATIRFIVDKAGVRWAGVEVGSVPTGLLTGSFALSMYLLTNMMTDGDPATSMQALSVLGELVGN